MAQKLKQISQITEAHFSLKDYSSASKIPELYESGSQQLRATIDKWDMFKCINLIIRISVNNKDLLKLYKPTDQEARNGCNEKVALPVDEYQKLIGKYKWLIFYQKDCYGNYNSNK